MFRTIAFTAVCLMLVSANSAVAQKPFKNKTARDAKKAREAAIAKANVDYLAQLDIAIKEAGGAGDGDEVVRLVAEKKRIAGSDPLTALRRRLIGTKWNGNPKTPSTWVRFDKNNIATHNNGTQFFWFVTNKNTIALQDREDLRITVWHFDDQLRRAKVYPFQKSTRAPDARKVR